MSTITDTPLFDKVHDAVAESARLIAWDGCHKIYVAMDDEQAEWFRTHYNILVESDDDDVLVATLGDWFDRSCGLRFIDAVSTNHENPNAGFVDLIAQGEADETDDDWKNANAAALADFDPTDHMGTVYVHRNGVVEVDPDDIRATVCGTCGRAWDDSVSTAVTPVPAGRCPFEYEHDDDPAEYEYQYRVVDAYGHDTAGGDWSDPPTKAYIATLNRAYPALAPFTIERRIIDYRPWTKYAAPKEQS